MRPGARNITTGDSQCAGGQNARPTRATPPGSAVGALGAGIAIGLFEASGREVAAWGSLHHAQCTTIF